MTLRWLWPGSRSSGSFDLGIQRKMQHIEETVLLKYPMIHIATWKINSKIKPKTFSLMLGSLKHSKYCEWSCYSHCTVTALRGPRPVLCSWPWSDNGLLLGQQGSEEAGVTGQDRWKAAVITKLFDSGRYSWMIIDPAMLLGICSHELLSPPFPASRPLQQKRNTNSILSDK